jgi:hypothetical protein
MTMSRLRFGRTVRRFGFPAASIGGVLIACLVAGSALGAGGGSNSTAAAPCLNGGWTEFVRSDGSPFASQAACVSYANKGGMLLAFTGCFVVDTDNPADASTNSLQAVVAAATAGDKIAVEGVCTGLTAVSDDLKITGRSASGYAAPTLQGSGGPAPAALLTVNAGAEVKVADLTITGGDTSAQGAGIHNDGTLKVVNSLVTDNVGAPAPAGPGLGSGIWNDGSLVLVRTTVSDNSDNQVGAGIMNASGTAVLRDSTVSDNTTTGDGGGIENVADLTLDGDTTVTGNSAFTGGGIDTNFGDDSVTTLNGTSSVSGNTARFGAGILNDALGATQTATLTLNDSSSVTGNHAETFMGLPGGFGGGIDNSSNSGGAATVTLTGHSSVAGNTAMEDSGEGGDGGGIYNDPMSATSSATVTIEGSGTISENSAVHGGGILNTAPGTLVNCLAGVNVSGNTPDDIES